MNILLSACSLPRLNYMQGEGAGDWLYTLLRSAFGLHLRPQESIYAVKPHLGAEVYRNEGEYPAPMCRQISDKHGNHSLN